MQFLKQFIELLFPPKCEVCHSIGPELFCSKCMGEITYIKPSTFVHSIGLYNGPLKKAIKSLKYGKKIGLAAPLGDILARYIMASVGKNSLDFIIPVPLHVKKEEERGFNQSEKISKIVSSVTGIPTVVGILNRTRETRPQFEVDRDDRLQNVYGAFELLNRDFIAGKRIALLDDIYTTGATISECTRVLKEGGAYQVHVFTLSRALHL